MLNRIRQILTSKKASGATIIGIFVILIAFTLILVCVNFFKLYNLYAEAQLICDTIADGASVAGQTESGFDDNAVLDMAQKLFQYNKIPNAIQSYTITIDDELDANGNPTSNKLITVKLSTKTDYYAASALSLANYITAETTSVVRVEVTTAANSWLSTSFYNNPTGKPPFATTVPGHRNPLYTRWLIEYYINPEHNPLYKAQGARTYTHYFISDYLKMMGLNIRARSTDQWVNYFRSTDAYYDGWYLTMNPEDAHKKVNEGKPIIILRTQPDGTSNVYCMIPGKEPLSQSQIAVAYVGLTNSNYEVIEWDSLFDDGASVYILFHE